MTNEQLKVSLDSIVLLAQKAQRNVNNDLYPATSLQCLYRILEEADKVKKHYQRLVNKEILKSNQR